MESEVGTGFPGELETRSCSAGLEVGLEVAVRGGGGNTWS